MCYDFDIEKAKNGQPVVGKLQAYGFWARVEILEFYPKSVKAKSEFIDCGRLQGNEDYIVFLSMKDELLMRGK